MDEEIDIARALNGSMDPVVEAVERINLARLECQVEQARHSHHIKQSEKYGSTKKQQGNDQGIGVACPMQKCAMSGFSEVRTLCDRLGHHDQSSQEKRQEHELIEQHEGGVGELS